MKLFLVAALAVSTAFSASAQQTHSKGKLEVSTNLKETVGTSAQRQLYREFLAEYMKQCPYINNFSIHEAIGSTDDHNVVWTYNVNSWDDITKFYGWVSDKLKSTEDDGLKKAMTPYKPDYAIGGQIKVKERGKDTLAKD